MSTLKDVIDQYVQSNDESKKITPLSRMLHVLEHNSKTSESESEGEGEDEGESEDELVTYSDYIQVKQSCDFESLQELATLVQKQKAFLHGFAQ